MGVVLIVVGVVLVLAAGQISRQQLKDKGFGTTDEVPADGSVVSRGVSGLVLFGYALVVVGVIVLIAS